MTATIRDVALAAGVSVGTVSNVINGRSTEFNEATRSRVESAIERLQYRPNRVARNLVRRYTHTLGLAYPDQHEPLGANPYTAGVTDGLIKRAQADGYDVTLFASGAPGREQDDVDRFLDGRADAICIVAPNADSPYIELMSATVVPWIVVGVEEPGFGASWIDIDNALGARMATECLLQHGHRRIAHLAGSERQKAARTRANAYRQTLEQAGIRPRQEWTRWCSFDEDAARAATLNLLSSPDRPTAIFAASDQMASGAITAVREAGLRCPVDLSVIGFDDIGDARLLVPALTTVHQPMFDIGARAAAYLIEATAGEAERGYGMRIAPELVMRASVAHASG